jgi:hypothetical protein
MKKYATSAYLILISVLCYGQSFNEIAELSDKKFSKYIQKDSPLGKEMKMLVRQGKITREDLKPLRRIGVLSFYINDDVWKEKSGNYLIWDYMTEKGANYFAQKFHDQAISALKTTIKTSGIELLTPNEFLDSPDKKQAYNSFEVKYTGLLKAVAGFANAVATGAGKTGGVSATPKGYRMFAVTQVYGQDPKVQRTVGKLAKDLDLDGVLVIQLTTVTGSKSTVLKDVQISMFGANPEKYDPEAKYPGIAGAGGYWEGKCYGWYIYPTGGVTFVNYKKKEVVGENYDGWPEFITRLADHFINYVGGILTYPE